MGRRRRKKGLSGRGSPESGVKWRASGKAAAAANERGRGGCGECDDACVAGENEKLVDF